MNKELVFYTNASEITAGTRGASLGSEAILTAARKKGSTIFRDYKIKKLKDCNHLLDQPTKFQFAKRIDGLITIYQKLNKNIANLLQKNKFPLVIAADHGSAGGTIAGIKTAFPDKKLGVIWIDAHADIHTPFTTPTGNIHGMPLATALNEDNLQSKVNEVSTETIMLWNQLKNIGNIAPKIFPEDLVYIGVRDTEVQEDSILNRLNIKNFTVDEVRKNGVNEILNQVNQKLAHCDILYVSFDVDSMDPDLTSYGTGTPVKNGLTTEEAKEILVHLIQNPKIVCMEIVEVNPCLDDKNTMAEVALELIEALINAIKK
jgi:arginase